MSLPHMLKRIRLELARSKEFPMGSARHGYEFVAPLDNKGHIDPHLWQKYRQHCGVRRFWNGEDEEIGRLTHKPGGAEHARWVFDYDPGERTTTKPDTDSAPMPLRPASMFQSLATRVDRTPSRSSPLNQRRSRTGAECSHAADGETLQRFATSGQRLCSVRQHATHGA
jgi:hypothetical protein